MSRVNLRLVRASQYLSSFNLELRHKAGKSNIVPDALSRLKAASSSLPETSDQSQGVTMQWLIADVIELMAYGSLRLRLIATTIALVLVAPTVVGPHIAI